ncbi:MAG: MFS transporter [Armatimonadetes bacterium]|nr:MFS transporter [Armatimonadota bacterium]
MDKHLTRGFASFYFILYVAVGLQAPYLFLYFKRLGFTDSQLGTLAAVTPIMKTIAPPVWGAIADMFGDRRRTLALLLVLAAVGFPWLGYTADFSVVLALLLFFSATAFPALTIADAIALDSTEEHGGDFGRLRLWGSIGFAAPAIALGLVLSKAAGESAASLLPIFWGYAIFRLISVAWVRLLPASRGSRRGLFDVRAIHMFVEPRLLALAACAVVAMGAMAAYYMYFSIYLDEVGIADNLKGYFWVVAVAAESSMMFVIGTVMNRIGLKWTFVLGIAGCVARLFAFSFTLGPAGIVGVQLLHALTFTALMISSMTFVSRMTPSGLRASGQATWAALTGGLGAALGSKVAGIVTGAVGLMTMFRFFSLAAALALVAAIIFVREPPEPASN